MGTLTDPNHAPFVQIELVQSSRNTSKVPANRVAGSRYQLQIRTRRSHPDTRDIGGVYIANSQGQSRNEGKPAVVQHFHVLKRGEGPSGSGCGVPFQNN